MMTGVRVDPSKLLLSEAYRSGSRNARVDPSRFWSYVDQSGGPDSCWPWTLGRDPAGYGQGPFGWTRKAHREAYRLTNGDFDTALDVCHSCDNPPCCNPAHLWLGTRSDNIMDASRKGRLNTAHGEGHSQAKLTWEKVRAIRQRAAAGEHERALAAEYGVSQPAIHYVVTQQTWRERIVAEVCPDTDGPGHGRAA